MRETRGRQVSILEDKWWKGDGLEVCVREKTYYKPQLIGRRSGGGSQGREWIKGVKVKAKREAARQSD